jgi:hypothetical protein
VVVVRLSLEGCNEEFVAGEIELFYEEAMEDVPGGGRGQVEAGG